MYFLFSQKVKYLGHVISSEGVSTDNDKIAAVSNWPIPQNEKHLRSKLGLCSYYRRFVKGFSILAKPLYALIENQTKFIWDEQCEDAFNRLKQALTSSLFFPYQGKKGSSFSTQTPRILESERFYCKNRMELRKSSPILVEFLIEQKEIIT